MHSDEIPWDKLGIPPALRLHVAPDAPPAARLAAARGMVPTTPDVSLAMLYVLAASGDEALRETVVKTVGEMRGVEDALSHSTHSKVIELVVESRSGPELDAKLVRLRNINDRSVKLVAARAGAELADILCSDHERLMMTPDIYLVLKANLATPRASLERAAGYLRMQGCLPDDPPPPPAPKVVDLEAEIEAALAGRPSPALLERQKMELFDLDAIKGEGGSLAGFSFDFKSDDEFSLDLTGGGDSDAPPEVRLSIEKQIANMSPGKKIKLAYLGNKESRNILLRDRNKQVSLAVVKSGRMTENEALSAAANRNLGQEVLRELASVREWMRKYPVKVALVNNPRCPQSITVPLVSQLHQKDLENLSRNRNVPSTIFTLALKLSKMKAANRE